jgi:hypothetical protein
MPELPARRSAVEEEILYLAKWLLEQSDLWEDQKLRLRQLSDHFNGRWSERGYTEDRPKVTLKVTLKRGRRKVPAQLRKFGDNILSPKVEAAWVKWKSRRTSELRRRPDFVQLLAYGNRVFLMVRNLSAIGRCPEDVLVRADRLREALDVIDVTLRLGGKVVG